LPHLPEKKKAAGQEDDGPDQDLDDGPGSLMAAVDGVCSPNRAARMSSLAVLASYLRQQSDPDEVGKYAQTLANSLFNCMRRGKCEERCRAAIVAALMAWSSGSADEIFEKMARYSEKILTTEIRKGDDYSQFVTATAIIFFVESPDSCYTLTFMQTLLESAEHEKSVQHRAASLRAWTFLFASVAPADLGGSTFVEPALQKMHAYLFDSETSVRLAAGEAIVMMFVRCNLGALLGPGSGTESGGLRSILERINDIERNIGDDSRKSKSDRTEQRREFKEFGRVLEGEAPKAQKICLPTGQTVVVESFEDQVFVNLVREFLGDGFLRAVVSSPIVHQVLDFVPVEFAIDRYNLDEKRVKDKDRARMRKDKAENCAYL
jgi:hypothetical protein